MSRLSKSAAVTLCLICVATIITFRYKPSAFGRLNSLIFRKRTVPNVMNEIADSTRARFQPSFNDCGTVYPPHRIAFLAMKSERSLEVWADDGHGWKFVRFYPILAASGKPGPKRLEGDRQVPEGIYRVAELNPNSAYHLSMKLNYPNEFDREHAAKDGRTNLGGDIFIHGKAASIGCLAMGDTAIEELFVMADDAGLNNVEIAIVPFDPRTRNLQPRPDDPSWVAELYAIMTAYFKPFVRESP